MPSSYQQTLTFSAGALVPTETAVRVRSNRALTASARAGREIEMAVLAEGTRWEVRVFGGAFAGTWYVDVPPECQDLAPADRMIAVDKIMRRIAEGAKQQRQFQPAIAGRRQLALSGRTA